MRRPTSFLLAAILWCASSAQETACSLDDRSFFGPDPNLQVLEYDVGDGPQTTLVYVEPNVTTFYRNQVALPSTQKVTPAFDGLQAKFVNLSNQSVTFFWEDRGTKIRHVMRYLDPWTATGTASFPNHQFVMTPRDDETTDLVRITVQAYPQNNYYYDPYHIRENPTPPSFLGPKDQKMYTRWRKTVLFDDQYKAKTGRSYLANYLRAPPLHMMWPAEYFGQEHWVTSRETHFTQIPPEEELKNIRLTGRQRRLTDDQPRLLEAYRNMTEPLLNLTLRVLSVAPRVLEIPNFLSSTEVQHIIELAHRMHMKKSTTGDALTKETAQLKTRTSKNTWVSREETPIIDTIYRRAADVQLMDEALLRFRDPDERPDLDTRKTLGEQLQLVHYDQQEEYTAHHDFGFARLEDEKQAARFSTLLLYLNDVPRGGETSFPRWANSETFHKLKVKPEACKAVLFYSQLPDGNFDDLSHHAAEPVIEGEKYLINLWTW